MAKDPGFKFYPGDYLRDTQNLSEKSQVAYDRIMCEHMRNICSDMNNITVSKKAIEFFTKRLSDAEKDEVYYVLNEINGGYQIEWVALSISKSKTYSESRAKNRTKTHENISKTYDKHMDNDNDNDNDKDIDNIKGGVGEKINFADLYNSQWFESVLSFLQYKIDLTQLLKYWELYQKAMIADDDLYREKNTYRSHFRNWVKIQVEKNARQAPGGILKPKYELLNDL